MPPKKVITISPPVMQTNPARRSPSPSAAGASAKRKTTIPKALREQVWITHIGTEFEGKCCVTWCKNRITAFQFECGHNIPESKGGATHLTNLRPICSRCNTSMGNAYTIDEWNAMGPGTAVTGGCCGCWPW